MKKMRIFHEVNTMPTYFLGIIKSIQGKLLPPRKPRRIQLFHFLLLFSFLFAASFPQETAIFRLVFTSNPHRKSLRQCFRTFGRNLLSRFLPEKTGAAHDKGWRYRAVNPALLTLWCIRPGQLFRRLQAQLLLTSFQRKNRGCKTQKSPAENGRAFFLKFVLQMVSADYLMSGKIRDRNSSQKPFGRFLPICPLWGLGFLLAFAHCQGGACEQQRCCGCNRESFPSLCGGTSCLDGAVSGNKQLLS